MKGTGETRVDNEQRYVQEKEHGSLKTTIINCITNLTHGSPIIQIM
jgi:hypothetical protein